MAEDSYLAGEMASSLERLRKLSDERQADLRRSPDVVSPPDDAAQHRTEALDQRDEAADRRVEALDQRDEAADRRDATQSQRETELDDRQAALEQRAQLLGMSDLLGMNNSEAGARGDGPA
ncbi:hypothetical protein [Actinoplanes sp. DH11]|uniref:hypothetical protein n=1 Tax=Actinoplanes sp. DH11 TaxID=2857011 RepID=UPI001E4624DD|nr:hypothetical protein [Actinoplanes sp. DH11]